MTLDQGHSHRAGWAFLTLSAPFFLNDLGFIAVGSGYGVYLVDYATRILVLTFALSIPLFRGPALGKEIPATLPILWSLAAIPALVLIQRAASRFVEHPIWRLLDGPGWFRFGAIDAPALWLADITIGIALVAISEELVFRRLALRWMRARGWGDGRAVLVSALIFAAMYWGSGLHRVASTFVFGAAAMAIYIRLGRLWPIIAAHYIANLIVFA